MKKKVAIIGGGASGFFAAINLAEQCANVDITIYEASDKLLSKVLISGGGRCNITNQLSNPEQLAKCYPRGREFLQSAFHKFTSTDTIDWFELRGVFTKCEADGRVFPVSNTSQTIYDLFLSLARKQGVTIKKKHRLNSFDYREDKYQLSFNAGTETADYLLLCCSISKSTKAMLSAASITTSDLVPSLFTFNAATHAQKELSGISVAEVKVRIKEIENSESSGPILITHWGYSGPAILKLSAFKALELNKLDYHFTLVIDWLQSESMQETEDALFNYALAHPKKRVLNYADERLPNRLWKSIISSLDIPEYTNWAEFGKKKLRRLSQLLHQFEVIVKGKTTFKEEFVTAGGIELDELTSEFEVKKYPNLFAIGEILNIDGITGGFNFQAAWTGSYLASKHIAEKEK